MSEELLRHIDLCCRGDADAFGYIVDQYQQLVYTLSFRMLCDEDDAKDATQETFIKVWRNISKYNQVYQFSTWIYRIATNICYDKLRTSRKATKVKLTDVELLSESNQHDSLHNKELKELILKVTEGLSPKQKLIFTLSDIEEMETEEICIVTGMTPAKIKSNLYLARKNIKSKIIDYE